MRKSGKPMGRSGQPPASAELSLMVLQNHEDQKS